MTGIFVLFLIALVISYVFKRVEIVKIWITYIVSFFIVIIFGGLFFLEIVLSKNSPSIWMILLTSLAMLALAFIIQLISNLLVIGKPFIKERETKSSSEILDDGFIK